MCFFNSMTVLATSVAKRYKRNITEQLELFEESEKSFKPAYAHPNSIIISLDKDPIISEWGLLPPTISIKDMERYRKENWFINARSEDAFEKWPYKLLLHSHRCIVPSTGFYEYHYEKVNGKEVSSVYRIYVKDEEIFSIGGLYSVWANPETGEVHNTNTMFTTEANEVCRWVHNGGKNPFRMPLIIPKSFEEKWLDPALTDEEIKEIMVPFPAEQMEAYEIDKTRFRNGVNDPGIDKPISDIVIDLNYINNR